MTALLLVFMLINFADKAVLGLAAKPIIHEFGLSPSEYGLLQSGFYALYGVSAIAVGFLSNRVSTKWILAVMALVWAFTMLPVILPVGFAVLLVSRIVLGAAEGPANPMAMHAAHKWFPNEKRSLPSALLNVGGGIGAAVAAPVLTAVIITFGWRWAFFALFAIGIVWVLLWLMLGEEGTVAGAARDRQTSDGGIDEPRVPYRRILLSGTGLGAFVNAFVSYWGLALLISWVPPYFQIVLGYSASETGTLLVLPWVANALFVLGQGMVSEWLMRRGVSSRLARGVLGGVAVMIAGIAMVLFPLTAGGLQLVLMTVAFSLGAIAFAIGSTVNSEISPTRQRGAVLSIYTAAATTAGLIAPYVTGRLIEAAATPATGYTIGFTVAGALLLLGGLLAALIVRPERDARRLGVDGVREVVARR
ncbi:MFS transporter [Saccharopolyspora shandongensis]|uniref:MFS transporter n=1 Tax=Saccharopolyspora shandongensis TaxID=418495 RepID=UPI0033CA53F2